MPCSPTSRTLAISFCTARPVPPYKPSPRGKGAEPCEADEVERSRFSPAAPERRRASNEHLIRRGVAAAPPSPQRGRLEKPSGSPAVLSHHAAALTPQNAATTPQAEACGVASAYPRLIPSEAGLAPSGSPAVLSHCSAATDSPQNSDNPAGRSLRGCLSMTLQTQRSVFLNWDAGELRRGQITPTALPSSRQTAS